MSSDGLKINCTYKTKIWDLTCILGSRLLFYFSVRFYTMAYLDLLSTVCQGFLPCHNKKLCLIVQLENQALLKTYDCLILN